MTHSSHGTSELTNMESEMLVMEVLAAGFCNCKMWRPVSMRICEEAKEDRF
jgi:hypothetical protein